MQVIKVFLLLIFTTHIMSQDCINVPTINQPVGVFNELIQQIVTTLDYSNPYDDIETLDVLYDPTQSRYQFIFRQNLGESMVYTGVITQYNEQNKQHIVTKFIRSFDRDDIIVSLGYQIEKNQEAMQCKDQKVQFTNDFGNYSLSFLRKFQSMQGQKTTLQNQNQNPNQNKQTQAQKQQAQQNKLLEQQRQAQLLEQQRQQKLEQVRKAKLLEEQKQAQLDEQKQALLLEQQKKAQLLEQQKQAKLLAEQRQQQLELARQAKLLEEKKQQQMQDARKTSLLLEQKRKNQQILDQFQITPQLQQMRQQVGSQVRNMGLDTNLNQSKSFMMRNIQNQRLQQQAQNQETVVKQIPAIIKQNNTQQQQTTTSQVSTQQTGQVSSDILSRLSKRQKNTIKLLQKSLELVKGDERKEKILKQQIERILKNA